MPDMPQPTPEQIHQLEQRWAFAEQMLDGALEALRHDIPIVSKATGLSDNSIVFDFMHAFIMQQELRVGNSHQFTVAMCAAAMTRLARASRAAEEVLAQLEEKLQETENNNDDKH